MTAPDEATRAVRVGRARRIVRIAALCLLVAAIVFLGATSLLAGR